MMIRAAFAATALLLAYSASAFAQSDRCMVPNFTGADSAAGAVASMRIVNDGKSCGIHLNVRGNDVASITVTEPPTHGKVGTKGPRAFYTAESGYVGKDQFRIISSSNHRVLVQVDVVAPSK